MKKKKKATFLPNQGSFLTYIFEAVIPTPLPFYCGLNLLLETSNKIAVSSVVSAQSCSSFSHSVSVLSARFSGQSHPVSLPVDFFPSSAIRTWQKYLQSSFSTVAFRLQHHLFLSQIMACKSFAHNHLKHPQNIGQLQLLDSSCSLSYPGMMYRNQLVLKHQQRHPIVHFVGRRNLFVNQKQANILILTRALLFQIK